MEEIIVVHLASSPNMKVKIYKRDGKVYSFKPFPYTLRRSRSSFP